MQQNELTIAEVEKRALKRMTLSQLATYCDNLEKDIQKSTNKQEIAALQSKLSQADKTFDNRMSHAEDSLMDRN